MRHALKGVLASSVVLGLMAPTAFAATTTTTYTQVKKAVVVDGKALYNPYGFVASDGSTQTTYMPIWYVGKALEAAGFTQSWDAPHNTWILTTSTNGDFSKISVGTGSASIEINGHLVKKINTHVAKDPGAGKNAQQTGLHADLLCRAAF